MGGDQFLLQVGQQFGIARRIVGPDVVRLVNDAAAQQPGPDAVDDVAREPGILRARSASRRTTSRGSWSGRSGGPGAIGKDRRLRRDAALVSGSKKTISSFHSRGGLVADLREEAAMPASRSFGHFSARTPMNVRATAWAMACGSLLCMAR